PLDRRAGAEGELGHDHRRRAGASVHAALGRDRAGGDDRADRAVVERARRRPARRARPAREAEDQGLMAAFVVRRSLWLAAVLLTITVLVFLIFFATPGVDPARQMAGKNPAPETITQIRHQFGLDRPLPVRYGLFMKHLLISRDLVSYSTHFRVIPQIVDAMPVTFSLVFVPAVIWVVASILTGVAASVLKGTVFDPLLMVLALI